MTNKEIDKLMKPYWDWKFKNSYLGDFCGKGEGWSDDWYGIVMKKPDGVEKLITNGDTSTYFREWLSKIPSDE